MSDPTQNNLLEEVIFLRQRTAELKAALQHSEERLRLLVEHTPTAVAMLDRELKYILVSKTWLSDYRVSEQAVIGRAHYELFPDLPQHLRDVHQRCLAGAVEYGEADPFPRADGTVDWVRWECRPWYTNTGEIGGIFILTEVITSWKQAEDRVLKLNRTLSVLSDVNQAIVRVREISVLFENICQIAVEKGRFQLAWIGLFDPITRRVVPAAYAGLGKDYLDYLNIVLDDSPVGRGPAATTIRTGKLVVCNDIQTDDCMAPSRDQALHQGYRSLVALPLIVSDEIRGCLCLYAGETGFFNEEEIRLLDEMAGDVSFAMEFAEQETQRQQAEAALRTSEAALKRSQEVAHIGNWAWNTRANTVSWSDEMYRIFGLRRENFTGDLTTVIAQAIHPDDQEAVNRSNEAVLTEARPAPLEYRVVRPDGTIRWVRGEAGDAVCDETGQVVLLTGIVQDITERKQAEIALRESEARFRAAFENANDGVCLVGLDGGFLQVNAALCQILGYNREELKGMSVNRITYADDLGIGTAFIQSAISGQSQHTILEKRYIHKQGQLIWAMVSSSLIRDDQGQPLYFISHVQDITQRKQSEIALRESEARFRAAFENANDGVCLVGLDGRFLQVNAAFCQMFGYCREEFEKMTVNSISHPDDTNISTDFIQSATAGQTQHSVFDKRYIHKQGQVIWGTVSSSLIHDDQGRPLYFISHVQDITQRKHAQAELLRYQEHLEELVDERTAELQQARQRVEAILTSSSDAIVLIHLERGIQQTNPAFERIFGSEAGAYLGQPLAALIHPEDATQVEAMLLQAQKRAEIDQTEVRVQRRDGSTFDAELSLARIVQDGYEQPELVCILRDVTRRKQAEQAIRDSEARYRLLAENVKDMIVKISVDGIRTYVTPSCYALLGYWPEELIGQIAFDLVHPEDRSGMQEKLQAAFQSDATFFTSSQRVQHKDGHYIWVELQSTIIRDAITGAPQEVIGVVRDITERRRLEDELRQALNKEKELNGLKSQFISMVSHEFRTPLAAIQSSTDLLKLYGERMTEERRREHLEKAQTQIRRLTDLMDDVLLLNRAQARGIEFNPITLDLELFCRSVVEDMQVLTESHTIRFIADACQTPMVSVDPKLVRRALTNLLSNAIKYSTSGSTVWVELQCDSRQATIVVRDQGIGIPAADQKHLFEDFYRATNVGTISGTGMGLTIVQQAVKAHNGTITFESEAGKGTTFTITLPVLAVPPDASGESKPQA